MQADINNLKLDMKDARLSDAHRFGKKVTLSESTVEPGACYNDALSIKKNNKLSCKRGKNTS